jgi:drug/metabolite transporter (DMT)-like permease
MQRPRLAASCCSKRRALRGAGDGPLVERIAGFLLNGYFFVALILYAALTVLWVWILSFTPLSRAYPFLALAFALTPALGCLVFAEPFSMRLVIGIVLILCGLFFIAG